MTTPNPTTETTQKAKRRQQEDRPARRRLNKQRTQSGQAPPSQSRQNIPAQPGQVDELSQQAQASQAGASIANWATGFSGQGVAPTIERSKPVRDIYGPKVQACIERVESTQGLSVGGMARTYVDALQRQGMRLGAATEKAALTLKLTEQSKSSSSGLFNWVCDKLLTRALTGLNPSLGVAYTLVKGMHGAASKGVQSIPKTADSEKFVANFKLELVEALGEAQGPLMNETTAEMQAVIEIYNSLNDDKDPKTPNEAQNAWLIKANCEAAAFANSLPSTGKLEALIYEKWAEFKRPTSELKGIDAFIDKWHLYYGKNPPSDTGGLDLMYSFITVGGKLGLTLDSAELDLSGAWHIIKEMRSERMKDFGFNTVGSAPFHKRIRFVRPAAQIIAELKTQYLPLLQGMPITTPVMEIDRDGKPSSPHQDLLESVVEETGLPGSLDSLSKYIMDLPLTWDHIHGDGMLQELMDQLFS